MCFVQAAALAVETYGKFKEGDALAEAGRANAREIENQRINDELETRESVRRKRIRNRKDLALQRVAGVKSGFRIDAGSPLELMAENASNLELAVQDEIRAGKVRSKVAKGKAELSIFRGKQERSAARLGAFTTLASKGASIAQSAGT